MSAKDILVSIVNGNNKGFIDECVCSIINRTKGVSIDIVVIDNCTGYDGLDKLAEYGAEVIVNKYPMGFAANHNHLLERAKEYSYWLIFNDDAYLTNNAFYIMKKVMDAENNVAITGCNIADPDGRLQPSAAPFPGLGYFLQNQLGLDKRKGERFSTFLVDYIDYSESQYVDWVTGCCMMLRMSFVSQYGFLDTHYFMFLEDADVCRRANKNGYKVKYVAEATIAHYGAGSSRDKKGKYEPKLLVERQKSRLHYLKRYAKLQYVVYMLFVNIYLTLKIIQEFLLGKLEKSRRILIAMNYLPLV